MTIEVDKTLNKKNLVANNYQNDLEYHYSTINKPKTLRPTTMSVQKTNNPSQWQDVFTKNRTSMLETAGEITGCHKKAEDILQDAYIKVIEKSPYESVNYHKSFAFRVIRNLSIDHYRRKKLERNLFQEDEKLDEQQTEYNQCINNPERSIICMNQFEVIDKALSKMSERSQNTFKLLKHDGLSQVEISNKLKISPTLVNFIIKDVISDLKLALTEKPQYIN